MAIVIDGYNFLDGANILALGPGRYSLEKSRMAILRVLRAKLTPSECETTTVVFDGTEAPIGLKRRDRQFGITIIYSARGQLADDVIEDLIAMHSHPRQLTVVSSDHRLHRAAKRRDATPVDSDVWYRGLLGRTESPKSSGSEANVGDEIAAGDVEGWLKEFGDIDVEQLEAETELPPQARRPRTKAAEDVEGAPSAIPNVKPKGDVRRDSDDNSPFPDGYGEDALEDSDGNTEPDFNPFPEGYGEDLL